MDKKVFDFITEDEKKELSCSDEEVREGKLTLARLLAATLRLLV